MDCPNARMTSKASIDAVGVSTQPPSRAEIDAVRGTAALPRARRRARPRLYVGLAIVLMVAAVGLVVLGIATLFLAPLLGALAVGALVLAALSWRATRSVLPRGRTPAR